MTGVGNTFSHAGFLSMKAHRLFCSLVMERFGLLVGRASSRAGRAQLASSTNLASGVMRSSLSPRRGEGLRVRGEAPLTPRQSDSRRRFTPHPGPLPSEGRGRTRRYVLVVLSSCAGGHRSGADGFPRGLPLTAARTFFRLAAWLADLPSTPRC